MCCRTEFEKRADLKLALRAGLGSFGTKGMLVPAQSFLLGSRLLGFRGLGGRRRSQTGIVPLAALGSLHSIVTTWWHI
jgi:hypothetical protein